ncbi:hypothetical protein CTI12_AA236770 [Artemisia annua]|uniref:Uncharacterized protein n=1 Tax=Artemisia annua TaxID=35608 RepID=A0A2U1NRQ5_ARTAN|nr:hypothetical protein CTI12_AA236770 [Artemisia annua]
MEASDMLFSFVKLRSDCIVTSDSGQATDEHSFVDLGSVWHAPLFEIALAPHKDYRQTEGFVSDQNCEKRNIPAFGSLVANETNSDMEADFLNRIYIIPKQSSFYMKMKRLQVTADYCYALNVRNPALTIESSLHDTSGPVRSLSEFGVSLLQGWEQVTQSRASMLRRKYL